MPEIIGWQDHDGNLRDYATDPPPKDDVGAIVAALRVHATDPETGEDVWFTYLGPYDLQARGCDTLDCWVDKWTEIVYGEFA